MFGYIYETTNLINGKKYIGKRISNKFLRNKYLGSGIAIKRAINKYGKENFSVRILEEIGTNREDLDNRETYWIKYYNAVVSKNYYNNSYDGEDEGWYGVNKAFKETNSYPTKFKGRHHTDESKLKTSNTLKGRISPNKGKALSEEHKEKIRNTMKTIAKTSEFRNSVSVAVKKAFLKNPINRNKGKALSEEHKNKISKSCKGKYKNYIWITNGVNNRFVNQQTFEILKEHGYYRGMTRKKVI